MPEAKPGFVDGMPSQYTASIEIDHNQWQQDLKEGMLPGLQEPDAGGPRRSAANNTAYQALIDDGALIHCR